MLATEPKKLSNGREINSSSNQFINYAR